MCGTDPFRPDECEAAGGTFIADSGDGSTARDGCPNGAELLGGVNLGIEGGICCREQAIDCDACSVVVDPSVCGGRRPVHWECFAGAVDPLLSAGCTDRATDVPRYCCPLSLGARCQE